MKLKKLIQKKEKKVYKVKRLFQRYAHPLTFNTTMISFIKKKKQKIIISIFI